MRKRTMPELNRASVEEFRVQEKLPVVVVLDQVRSMHNVGSVFRTADGFSAEQIVLCGITGQPPHREIEKTALGATSSVAWKHEPDTVSAVKKLRENGYLVLAVEQVEGSIPLNEFTPKVHERYALVFGNEVHGVQDEVLAVVDGCLEIPQFGTKHSFNIVVSAGIVLWDFFAKLNLNQIPNKPIH